MKLRKALIQPFKDLYNYITPNLNIIPQIILFLLPFILTLIYLLVNIKKLSSDIFTTLCWGSALISIIWAFYLVKVREYYTK